MGFPAAASDAMLPKQASRDGAVAVSLQPSIESTQLQCESFPALQRQSRNRSPERAPLQRQPESPGCVRANAEIRVKRQLDRKQCALTRKLLQPKAMPRSSQGHDSMPAIACLPKLSSGVRR